MRGSPGRHGPSRLPFELVNPSPVADPGRMTPLERRASGSLALIFAARMLGLFLVLRALLPGVTSAGNPPLIAYAYYVFHCVRGALAERRQ